MASSCAVTRREEARRELLCHRESDDHCLPPEAGAEFRWQGMIALRARDPQFEVRLGQSAARERLNRNYVKHIADHDKEIDGEAGFILIALSNFEDDLIAIE
jgi:hypothetical protein